MEDILFITPFLNSSSIRLAKYFDKELPQELDPNWHLTIVLKECCIGEVLFF